MIYARNLSQCMKFFNDTFIVCLFLFIPQHLLKIYSIGMILILSNNQNLLNGQMGSDNASNYTMYKNFTITNCNLISSFIKCSFIRIHGKNLSLKMRRCNKEKLSNFLDKGRHRKFLCMGLLFYIVGLQLTHFIGYLQTPLVTKVCRKI